MTKPSANTAPSPGNELEEMLDEPEGLDTQENYQRFITSLEAEPLTPQRRQALKRAKDNKRLDLLHDRKA